MAKIRTMVAFPDEPERGPDEQQRAREEFLTRQERRDARRAPGRRAGIARHRAKADAAMQGRDSQRRLSARSRRGHERQLSVRGELREAPDVAKIARAVIQMALADAETQAADQHDDHEVTDKGVHD